MRKREGDSNFGREKRESEGGSNFIFVNDISTFWRENIRIKNEISFERILKENKFFSLYSILKNK